MQVQTRIINQSVVDQIVGRSSRAVTPRGLEVETQFVLCEASLPITSHDVNLNPNPDFPARIQNRDRAKVSTEDDLNEKIARFEPAYLGDSISAGDGAPILGPDFVVESGNGRVILLRRLYRDHPRKAAEYRGWLVLNAPSFGIDRDMVATLRYPILVRLRTSFLSPEHRIAFAEDANTDLKLKLSPVEVARGDAGRLTPGLLNQLYVDDDGEILGAANRPFISAFLNQVVGPARGDLLTSDGQLSQAGVLRIKAAIFARAYGSTDAGLQALEKLSESTDVNIKRLINAMLRYASRFAWLKDAIADGARYPLDLAPDLCEVARQLSLLREQGRTVEEHLKQMGLFGDSLSRVQKKLLFVFNQYRNSAKAMGGILGKYLDAVDALGDPRQDSVFEPEIPDKETLLERAVRLYEDGEGEQGGLFGPVLARVIGDDKQALFIEQKSVITPAVLDAVPFSITIVKPKPVKPAKPAKIPVKTLRRRESVARLVNSFAKSKHQTKQGDKHMEPITLTFTKDKETKNTIKFEENERDGQPKIVGSLYLQKFIAKGRESITVTIQ